MAYAKKRFGQNFLIDKRKVSQLIKSLELESGDTVLEIGPGRGALTSELIKNNICLIAVELDRELIPNLVNQFGKSPDFKLIEADIINIDLEKISDHKVKVIGNLPYNISGAIVDWLIDNYEMISSAVITVQKEVAERFKASPNSREYGSLSVILQSFYNVKKQFNIPPGCFSPKPNVMSTALKLTPDKKIEDEINFNKFADFLRNCFSQKRKKLANSLAMSAGIDKIVLEKSLIESGFKADIRAEQLELREFIKLFKIVGGFAS